MHAAWFELYGFASGQGEVFYFSHFHHVAFHFHAMNFYAVGDVAADRDEFGVLFGGDLHECACDFLWGDSGAYPSVFDCNLGVCGGAAYASQGEEQAECDVLVHSVFFLCVVGTKVRCLDEGGQASRDDLGFRLLLSFYLDLF